MTEHSKDLHAEHIAKLTREMGRIAHEMARLTDVSVPMPEPADMPEVSIERVRAILRARRVRDRHFPEEIFADPAWDILLDLFEAEIGQQRVSVSSACAAAAVPATTALRWISSLVDKGLLVRCADPLDGRRIFVELSPTASIAMRRYFAEVGPGEAG